MVQITKVKAFNKGTYRKQGQSRLEILDCGIGMVHCTADEQIRSSQLLRQEYTSVTDAWTEVRAQECQDYFEDIPGQLTDRLIRCLQLVSQELKGLSLRTLWRSRIVTIIRLERRMEATYVVADSNVQRQPTPLGSQQEKIHLRFYSKCIHICILYIILYIIYNFSTVK